MARLPAAPVLAPVGGSIDMQLARLAEAINRKADANTDAPFASIILTSSDGSRWKVSVSPAGVLSTTVVS